MGKFADQVNSFADDAEEKLDRAIRKIALTMFERVIIRSPVRSGRFKGNWQVAIGAVPTGTLEVNDKTGQIAMSTADAVAGGFSAGETIYLVNNLPYGPRLEAGHSSQAPGGMVNVTVAEFQAIVAQIGLSVSLS